MLKIVIVGNTFQEVKHFIKYKFKDKIKEVNKMKQIYPLHNGDEIHMANAETTTDMYKSYEWDAFTFTPQYITLFDVMRRRTER